jgi:3-deoxy-7-phosphoheptulonate synthase
MSRPNAHPVVYDDSEAFDRASAALRRLPPLVTSWEIDRLKRQLAQAQEGERFLLQGGDCAESIAECRPTVIANQLKILLQISLVLVHGGKRPVIRVGRFAGQYAKPRSKPIEKRGDTTLPSYFGDLVNDPKFTAEARRADPDRLLRAYHHSALTLNFIRSLAAGGFADLHHPENWDLSFFHRADLTDALREQYRRTSDRIIDSLHLMEAATHPSIDDLTRVEFFTSHEGLLLPYEAAQTRQVPHAAGYYDLTTHLPWIGERTRDVGGAHVEFFSGIQNPLGMKLGPQASVSEVERLLDRLNPLDEPGKIVLITRMGVREVGRRLPGLLRGVNALGRRVLWVCDPMHGNTRCTASGIKTRNFDDILREIESTFDVHATEGSSLGGVHFELTGEDVTECTGGGVTEEQLGHRYASLCDPRLNYRQALEMANAIAERAGGSNVRAGAQRRDRAA